MEKPKTAEKPPEKAPHKVTEQKPGEAGGPKGLEPTRYGDWEKNGRVSDF
jgi:hypothetical protein